MMFSNHLLKIQVLLKMSKNEIIEHKTYTDKQISKRIFDLVKLKKITRKESNDVSKLYDKQIYNAETHEELKAIVNGFDTYYNNMMELPEREEEHSFLSNKNKKYMIFVKVIL